MGTLTLPATEVFDSGITDFGQTFPRRLHAFLEDVSNGVFREDIRASGRDALATLEYTFAVIESYERAAPWCGRTRCRRCTATRRRCWTDTSSPRRH